MANNSKIIVVRGKAHWCKLLGKARPYTGNPKFDKGPLWSIDLTPLDKAEMAKLKAAGITDKLKTPSGDKETRTEQYLRLSVLENKADGEKNRPPAVTDAQGNPWDQETLIGNESIVDVMIKVVDYGTTVGAYFQKMRVLKLNEYEGGAFAPLSADDEYFAAGAGVDGAAPSKGGSSAANKPSKAVEPDLDDDVPF